MASSTTFDLLASGFTDVKKSGLPEDERFCAICRDEFEHAEEGATDEPETPAKVKVCGHVFGRRCLLRHVLGGLPSSFRCPMCREILIERQNPNSAMLLPEFANPRAPSVTTGQLHELIAAQAQARAARQQQNRHALTGAALNAIPVEPFTTRWAFPQYSPYNLDGTPRPIDDRFYFDDHPLTAFARQEWRQEHARTISSVDVERTDNINDWSRELHALLRQEFASPDTRGQDNDDTDADGGDSLRR